MGDVAKIGLLITIFFSTGMFILPSTVSLFAGQHLFYNVSESNCVKCHADIFAELGVSTNHSMVDGVGGLSGEECLACHGVNLSAIEGEHASTLSDCGYCHFNSTNPFGAPVAGGFGLSDLANDTGIAASHLSFVVQSANAYLLPNETESCTACHTPMLVEITFNVSARSKIVVNNTYNIGSYWRVELVNITGFTIHREVKD
jgi:hypothetical protein